MFKRTIYLLLSSVLTLFSSYSYSSEVTLVRVLGQQSAEDVTQDYFYQLLGKALKAGSTDPYYTRLVDATSLTQGRSMQLLTDDIIDVYWMGTTIESENKFHAVKIPLMKGLLGYRVSILKKQNLSYFSQLNEAELKQKVACQGEHWPDTKILQANGYKVAAAGRYDAMFAMVNKGRCQYFPRAIFEGYGELAVAQKTFNDLVMLDDVLLHYPYPIYYFVNKKNIALSMAIEIGLEKLIDSGEFDSFMQNHKVTKYAFPLDKWKGKRIFQLNNPLLSKQTDPTNPRYWITTFN